MKLADYIYVIACDRCADRARVPGQRRGSCLRGAADLRLLPRATAAAGSGAAAGPPAAAGESHVLSHDHMIDDDELIDAANQHLASCSLRSIPNY